MWNHLDQPCGFTRINHVDSSHGPTRIHHVDPPESVTRIHQDPRCGFTRIHHWEIQLMQFRNQKEEEKKKKCQYLSQKNVLFQRGLPRYISRIVPACLPAYCVTNFLASDWSKYECYFYSRMFQNLPEHQRLRVFVHFQLSTAWLNSTIKGSAPRLQTRQFWHEHQHCSTGNDVFKHNVTSTVG